MRRDEISLRRRFVGAAVVLLAVAATASAADPQFRSIIPVGGQRGAEVEVTLRGARLGDAHEILCYSPGIEVVELTPIEKNDNAFRAKLKIAGDCPLGPHGMRIRTASGVSNLLTFSVGALPVVDEAEPNNEFDSPQAVALDRTVHGTVENEDVDYFVIEAKRGERLSVEVEGIRLGGAFFDPSLAVLDTKRFVLAAADDTPLVRQDAALSLLVPEDGRHVIEVRESAYGGSGACKYRLHVGRFPRPLAVYPPGGKLGSEVEVRWLGDVAGEWTEKITLPAEPVDDFALLASDDRGVAPSPNRFRLSPLENVQEVEPNANQNEATAFEAPAAVNGILTEPGDVDTFKFSAKKGQVYEVRVFARELRSPVDSVISIRQIGGGAVGSNDDNAGSPDSYLRFRAPADAQYALTVRDQLHDGGPHYVYRVEFSPVEPDLTLTLPERSQNLDTVAPVPQGNRLAVMVQARRSNFGGRVDLELADLPPGIEARTVPFSDGETTVPLLLTAAKDAKPAGRLVSLSGRHEGENRTVDGRLRQTTSLVQGRNNRAMLNFDAQRMATAVTEAVPFSIDLVKPNAPLVRNGSTKLKVTAARDEGFEGEISLEMLYNPSGLSASRTIKIAKGKNEALLPVTANGSAKLGTWPIAVLGRTTVGNGAVVVSTDLVDLEVAEPFIDATLSPAAVEQGQPCQVAVALEKKHDFQGKARLELLGLPPNVTTEPQEVASDATEAFFKLSTNEKSPPGHHKSLRCRTTVTVEGEPVVALAGSGELRIRRPPPEKPAEPKKAQPQPKKEPAEKPLSRLEQLRLKREQAATNKE